MLDTGDGLGDANGEADAGGLAEAKGDCEAKTGFYVKQQGVVGGPPAPFENKMGLGNTCFDFPGGQGQLCGRQGWKKICGDMRKLRRKKYDGKCGNYAVNKRQKD